MDTHILASYRKVSNNKIQRMAGFHFNLFSSFSFSFSLSNQEPRPVKAEIIINIQGLTCP